MKAINIYDAARERLQILNKAQQMLAGRIQKALPGKIHTKICGGRAYYYQRIDSKDRAGRYISLKDTVKLHNLLQKDYDQKAIKLVEKESSCIERLLSIAEDYNKQLRSLYASYPERSQSFIRPIDLSDDEFARRWAEVSYDRKPIRDEKAVFITDKGDRVRSKSELNISNELYKRGIPYKYECPLQLRGEFTIYPDFTVLNKRTRQVYFWEHRGMMDDRRYANDTISRIRMYEMNDLYIGESLIITEETSTIPLGTNDIRRTIKHYFGG